jgi:hypothetical protein
MQIQAPSIIFRPVLPAIPEPNLWLQPDAVVAYSTLFLGVVTLLLVFETRRMRLSNDRAMGELSRQAERAAQASRDSATAAQQTAAHSETMLQSRRAWVGVRDWTSGRASSTVEPLDGRVYLVNSGDSPALDVQISHTYAIWHQFDAAKIDYGDYFEPTHPILGPNLPVEKFIEFKYSDESSRQAVLMEDVTIFWYGIIRYRDIFEEKRETKFCFEYNIKNQGFELCILHNEAT